MHLMSAKNSELESALRDGLFSISEFLEAAGPAFSALVEQSPEAAIQMADQFGGWRIYIPISLAEGGKSPLNSVPPAIAHLVIKLYGQETLEIPQFTVLRATIRGRKAAALRRSGWLVKEIAAHLNLTERRVYQALAESAWNVPPIARQRCSEQDAYAAYVSGPSFAANRNSQSQEIFK